MANGGRITLFLQGKALAIHAVLLSAPDYWRIILEESKRTGNMIASRKLFDDSEAAHPITEEEFIKVENIRGKLFLVGAEDDALWDTAKYIRRMEKRLAEKPHSCEIEAVVYEHGTHFVFPTVCSRPCFPSARHCLSSWRSALRRNIPGSVKRLALTLTAA